MNKLFIFIDTQNKSYYQKPLRNLDGSYRTYHRYIYIYFCYHKIKRMWFGFTK